MHSDLSGEKVLFYQPWGIGDLIMFTPVMLNFRRHFPNARIDLACRTDTKVLMKNCPWISKIFELPLPQQRTVASMVGIMRSVRKEKYQLLFPGTLITTHYMGNLFVHLAGAERTIGNIAPKAICNKYTYPCSINRSLHRVEQNKQLFEAFVGDNADFQMEFYRPISQKDQEKADSILASLEFNDKKILGVHAGCDKANTHKRWPANKFSKLLSDFLSDYPDSYILGFLGPGEDNLASAYPKDKFGDRVAIIRDTLSVVAALLGRCSLVLTTDSGIGHIARAMGTPALAIMGPANPAEVSPYGPDGYFVTLDPPLSCMPCRTYQKTCSIQENYCLTNLTVEHVKNRLYPLWEKYNGRK